MNPTLPCPGSGIKTRVYGNTDVACVLCSKCGKVISVDPWIRGYRPGREPLLRARYSTYQLVPYHQIKNRF